MLERYFIRPQTIDRIRALVAPANPVQHGALPMRRVNFLPRLELDLTDRQDMFGALVQQLDDMRIELVNGFAMFGNVQSWPVKSVK